MFAQPDCHGSQPMNAGKPNQIWIEQCEAAQTIRERYGLEAAFDYAVGEKALIALVVGTAHFRWRF
jgi:hypothetical protein